MMNWYVSAQKETEHISPSMSGVMGYISEMEPDSPQYKAMQEFSKRMEMLKAKAQTEALDIIHRYGEQEAVLATFLDVFKHGTLRVPGLSKSKTRKIQNLVSRIVKKLRGRYRSDCKYLFPFIAKVIEEHISPSE